jgi:MSHA biogenesis protein MshM
MYRQHFGLKHAPFGKDCQVLWNHEKLTELEKQFNWLLKSPGLGLLTAEPGLGKTAALRQIVHSLNPHQYQVRYIAETDFGRLEFYRLLAVSFNLYPSYRRSQLWRDIKEHVTQLATQKNILPIIIIDEAQNLSPDFIRDFPSFLNFVFDSKDYMTVWLVGHPELARIVDRPQNTALASRVQARCLFEPIECSSIANVGVKDLYRHTLVSWYFNELHKLSDKKKNVTFPQEQYFDKVNQETMVELKNYLRMGNNDTKSDEPLQARSSAMIKQLPDDTKETKQLPNKSVSEVTRVLFLQSSSQLRTSQQKSEEADEKIEEHNPTELSSN